MVVKVCGVGLYLLSSSVGWKAKDFFDVGCFLSLSLLSGVGLSLSP